jgi:general secretion pathway protein F
MSNSSAPLGAITLADLIALSEEMAALARSGVPLERGLLNLGQEIPGQLGRTTRRLAERLERGEDLSRALAAEETAFPRVYRIVVQAGLKAGRLPVALEGLAVAARRLADLRRTIGLAIVYPLAVLLLAYGLFVLFVARLAPELQEAYHGFNIARHPLLDGLVWLGQSVHWWGPLFRLAVGAWVAVGRIAGVGGRIERRLARARFHQAFGTSCPQWPTLAGRPSRFASDPRLAAGDAE